MTNLDTLLGQLEPQKRPENKAHINELLLTQYVFDKAFRYAKLIIKLKKRSVEVGGFLTVPKQSTDKVARDVFLARDQEVTEGLYDLSAEMVREASKELREKGQRVIGWWHSHGRGPTYHSDIDKRNQETVLNGIAASNYITLQTEKSFANLVERCDGNTLLLQDPSNPTTRFELQLEGDPAIAIKQLKMIEKRRIAFGYSFVVNWSRWIPQRIPYCEVATRDICTTCSLENYNSQKVKYKVVEGEEQEIDDNQLCAEIEERVKLKFEKTYFLPQDYKDLQSGKGYATRKLEDFDDLGSIGDKPYQSLPPSSPSGLLHLFGDDTPTTKKRDK